MKNLKSTLLYLCLFILTGFYDNIFAVDWTKFTPPPCNQSFPPDSLWDGPKSRKICGVTGCGLCCYTVIFYDKYIPYSNDPNHGLYEVYISGIFFDKGCGDCPIESITDHFYRKTIEDSSSNLSFRQWLGGYSILESRQVLYTPGWCADSNNYPCDAGTIRCCETNYELYFNPDSTIGLVDSVTKVSEFMKDPQCPMPCIPKCQNPIYNPISDTLCYMDCNMGQWQYVTSDPITMSICPVCQITIHYRWRETINCEPTLTDVEVDSISLSPGCQNCPPSFSIGYYYWYSVHWALHDVGSKKLEDNECDTNYRIISKSCWGSDSLDNNKYYPCLVPACCIAQYKVCKDGDGTVTDKLLNIIINDDSLCSTYITPFPCEYICDETITPIELKSGEKNADEEGFSQVPGVNVIPNPAGGAVNITYRDHLQGHINLEIFDIMGVKKEKINLRKDGYEVKFEVDISNMSDGLNFFIISTSDKPLITGSFIIQK